MKKRLMKLRAGLAFIFFLFAWAGASNASIITHSGSTDPTAEGFSIQTPFGGGSNVFPLDDDLGHSAWAIAGLSTASELGYYSGPLSSDQRVDIDDYGFTLSLEARVVQGLAPAYDDVNHVFMGGAALDNGVKRYDILLSLDGNGDTVVILPTYVDVGGPGNSFRAFGSSFTLTGSGSTYHTYQLLFDPGTQLADLLVDGIERIQGYEGYSPNFVGNFGLMFAANSGGQVNFSSVQLASSPVPIPGAIWLLGSALVGLGAVKNRNVFLISRKSKF